MSQNISSDGAGVPLLEELSGSNGGKAEDKWWKKMVDVEEAKNQTCFAFPMILTNFFYFLITLVSVMFAGHLGQLQLAGATLANSWATVSGIAFLAGLSGALETLCGQAFGANIHRMLGVYLQASCIISFVLSVITSVIWFYTEPILVLLRQDPDIAKASALYLRYLIPGLFAYGLLQNLLRFLQTQSVVMPLIALSAIPTALHIGIAYVMVNWTGLGFKGAPLAASISLWISAIVLLTYVLRSKKFKNTWDGFSFESLSYILPCLKLALPSAAMVCLEYWAFELLVLLGGMMPDAELTTSLTAMCLNTEAIAFMCAFGFSAAVSTRVSNELGAGNPDKAKHAMVINLELAFVLVLIIILTLVFGHNIWASLFSDSATIIKAFASMTPFLAMSFTVDTFQAVLSGVARGCGWQHLAVIANLATFYLIGMPIAVLLGFKFKFYVKGLWVGLICGLFSNCCALLLISMRTKWIKVDLASSGDNGSSDLA